eukprot:2373329-Prymnesium_polylepis.1
MCIRDRYGGLCEARAMSWRMGGRAVVRRRCAERVVRGGGVVRKFTGECAILSLHLSKIDRLLLP